jgi:hypothetical protein
MPHSTYRVSNDRLVPHVVAVEPWGEDFTLLPGEALEIHAVGKDLEPRFELVEWGEATQVYCENTDDFKVMQGDSQLACGHQRQAMQGDD